MDALQRTTRTDIAAGVFLPLVQAAMQDRAYSAWLSSCRSRPQLVTPPGALAGALALGGGVATIIGMVLWLRPPLVDLLLALAGAVSASLVPVLVYGWQMMHKEQDQ